MDKAYELFVPQLFSFFFTILSFYDHALEGRKVSDYLEEFNSFQRNLIKEQRVQELWKKFSRDTTSSQSGTKPESKPSTTASPNTAEGKKSDSWILEESLNRQREALEGYQLKKEEIVAAWKELSSEKRLELLEEVRNLIATMGKSSYQNSLLYCPEISPSKLAEDKYDSSSGEINSFFGLVLFCLKLKPLPKQSPKTIDQTVAMLRDPSFGDPLIRQISGKMEAMGQLDMLPLIAISRHHVLFMYCHFVITRLLGYPLVHLIENIPGCTTLEENSSDAKSSGINLPFSSQAQREATPISTPPPPKSSTNDKPTVSETEEITSMTEKLDLNEGGKEKSEGTNSDDSAQPFESSGENNK